MEIKLDTHPLLFVISDIMQNRLTGSLTATPSNLEMYTFTLYFETGELVYAGSTDPDLQLAQWLVNNGAVTEDDAVKVLDYQKNFNNTKPLGEYFITELGYSPQSRDKALTLQRKQILTYLLSASKGIATFTTLDDLPITDDRRFSPPTISLLMASARKLPQLAIQIIYDRSKNMQFKLKTSKEYLTVPFSNEEKQIQNLFTNPKTVSEAETTITFCSRIIPPPFFSGCRFRNP